MAEASSGAVGTGEPLLGGVFATAAMAAVFSDTARIGAMLRFEAALARAEARLGVIPAAAVAAIEAQCDAAVYDLGALSRAAATAGNLAIPLVKELTARVAAVDEHASGYVHWGATSQDAIDTGVMLQLRAALDVIEPELDETLVHLTQLARRHRDTVMIGRTWLQQAVPVTLGLKAAVWLDALLRQRARVAALRALLVLQFGGAAGTLAALGARGGDVAAALAAELGLGCPDLPWHTSRDRIVEFATTVGNLVGTLGKIARDVALLMQTEVAEAFEPGAPGKGGSSTMPHKRNPVAAAAVQAAALRVPHLVGTLLSAMGQEHERGLGGWQAEWEVLPEIWRLGAAALAHVKAILAGLEVSALRMRENLEATHGLIFAEAVTMALGAALGRRAAHELVEDACRKALASARPLREVLEGMPPVTAHLAAAELEQLFDARGYLGSNGAFIDAVLARVSAAHEGRS